jgi:hypothetical protein
MRRTAREICAKFRDDYGKDDSEIEEEARKKTGYKRSALWLRDDDDDEEEVSK